MTSLTEAYQSLETLMPDIKGGFVDVMLDNTGDTVLRVAVDSATDARSKSLIAGDQLFLSKINLAHTYAKTTDDSGSNILEFVGTPI